MSGGGTDRSGNKPIHLMPLKEWQALDTGAQPPDTTPLTDEEKADLRRRLNAPGGAALKLPYRERAARWEMGIIRWPEDVQAVHAQVQAKQDLPQMPRSSVEYGEGILAAIEWATGTLRTAPISGEPSEEIPPSARQMSREAGRATDIAEGRERHPRGRSYAVGVEHTLMWLMAREDDPPV